MSEKHNQVSRSFNSFEHFLVFTSDGCVSDFAYPSLAGALAGIASSAVGIKIWKIAPGIRTYKPIIKKKMKKYKKNTVVSKK